MKNFKPVQLILAATVFIIAVTLLVCAARADNPEKVAAEITTIVTTITPQIKFGK